MSVLTTLVVFYPTVRLTQDKNQSFNALEVSMLDGHHASIGKKLLGIVVDELPEGQDGGGTNNDQKQKWSLFIYDTV